MPMLRPHGATATPADTALALSQQQREKRRVAFRSILAATVITALKVVVGFRTGSLGVLSEAAHSALDLMAAVITFVSVRVSDKPADAEHQYGHQKIENFSAFLQTGLLLLTCVWIVVEAVRRLAELPSREVLKAQLLSGLQTSTVQLLGVFEGVGRSLLGTLLAQAEVKS